MATRTPTERLGSVGNKRDGDEHLGLRLQEWHTSGGDPIYRLGSLLFSRATTVAEDASGAYLVRQVLRNLRIDARLQYDRAYTDPTTRSDRRPTHAALYDELLALILDVEARFAELLARYPENA